MRASWRSDDKGSNAW